MESKRKRGRPRKGQEALSAEQIITEALRHVRGSGDPLSLRAIARSLRVDPMAIYTYFPTREDLEIAVAVRVFASLYLPTSNEPNWRTQLQRLIVDYANLLFEHPGILMAVLRLGVKADAPAKLFCDRFDTAIAPLTLSTDRHRIVRDFIVDYVHGAVASGVLSNHGTVTVAHIEDGLAWYLDSIAASTQ